MLRRLAILLVAAWAVAALAVPGFAAGPVFPRGSRIGLEPPNNLVVSRRFNGFEDRAHDVALTMLDLPEPAYKAFEKSAFNKTVKGLTVDKRELFPFREGIGYLVTGHEEIKGTTFRSWYLLINTATREAGHVAALIAVRLPNNATRLYPDRVIRAALASVTFRKPPVAELLSLLPFKLEQMAGFRLLRIAPGGLVVLIDGPTDNLAIHPYMIISIGRGAPTASNLRPKFARDLLTRTPLPELVINSGEPMRIGNRPGYEVRATAKGAGGKPITLVQWLRFGGADTFLRIVGVVDKDRWDALFPRFRAVRDGVEVR